MEGFLLNEQTWLQHLKEKRLAYGLSQNRLAVATGITRQYLSDIETGKVKPSEDLQQSLWEALESVNELETNLDQSKESMYKLSYVVRVSANDLDELKRRCNEVKDFYDDLSVKLVRPFGDMLGYMKNFYLPASVI